MIFFNDKINELTKNAKDNDLISVCLRNKELSKSIYVAPVMKSQFDSKQIFDRIEKFAQSFRGFLLDGLLNLEVIITENIFGGGMKRAPVQLDQQSYDKRSVITIRNYDNSCGLRALFVSKYFHEYGRNKYWQNVRKDKNNMQKINRHKYICL